MSTLNYLCKNDISDDDCRKCAKHGIMFSCPANCKDFDDMRNGMTQEQLSARKRLMEKLGVKEVRV